MLHDINDEVYWLHIRRMGIGTPHARYVIKGEKYHVDYLSATHSHWIIVYAVDMIAHCPSLLKVPDMGAQMLKDFPGWRKRASSNGYQRHYTPLSLDCLASV